jgi:hypothetical protein
MELVLLVGVELALFIAVGRRIQTNRRLIEELRRCHADLYAALAYIGSGDTADARRLLVKWPDFARLPRPRPPEERRLH